ncbi:ATP-binding protein [Mucilaginibacter sp. BJC16-A38]|uniref:tetratricopeptide repeat-containing sensor histidine kinase n=1 Tax=Mucilaginibacter phenanthrenivorans TaxID=1234842 RepID=UPI0021588912|nr:tetratricopeptide repeat-containing sensor histidine kinase [Mucilaginibacter phenanthrenivorans]MCR8560385.1 ATP-binding protein [Mucilaginibacter phenanthrenivorans]
MKKLLLFFLTVTVLFSCTQKKRREPLKPDWTLYRKAYLFLYGHIDSAFYYFNRVTSESKDSLQVAMAYNVMASIQSDAGDHYGAQESLTLSLKFLNEANPKDHSCLANDYNELGMNSVDLKNYDAAISYYGNALRFTTDSSFIPVIVNNQAFAFQKRKDYTRALQLYHKLLAKSEKKGSAYTRILTNQATTKWLQGPAYNPAPELHRALNIRQGEQDQWGENSSYINLANYYLHSRPDSALFYARKMYAVATLLKSPDDQLEALQTLVKVAPPREAREYAIRFQEQNDSLQTARNAAKNQFALIRYDSEKNKIDNLKLQKENTEKKYQLIKQSILLYSALFVLATGSTITVFWYRKRKIRLQLEAENTIRENRLKLSQKIHDVVANGLYVIMAEVENAAEVRKEALLDKIEVLYDKSRDISYEEIVSPEQDFPASTADLLKSFATAETRVVFSGNDQALWSDVPGPVKQELQPILQELMVNMKKHSRAANAAIKFSKDNNHLLITYTDDGIGMPQDLQPGNGLTSTGNRIKKLNGTLSFAANGAKGLRVQIIIPIA